MSKIKDRKLYEEYSEALDKSKLHAPQAERLMYLLCEQAQEMGYRLNGDDSGMQLEIEIYRYLRDSRLAQEGK